MFNWIKKRSSKGEYQQVLPFNQLVDKSALKIETDVLWNAVSCSRSQFEDHYLSTIKNVAVYMQDKEAFAIALNNACRAVQGTQLIKLPFGRSRESGAKVEQLWKYTMFVCHLLKEAQKLNRCWRDKNGNRLLFVNIRDKGLQFDNSDTNRSAMLLANLDQILPENASRWLLEDDGKCLREVSRAASGLMCFIDSKVSLPEKTNSPEKRATTLENISDVVSSKIAVEDDKTNEAKKLAISTVKNVATVEVEPVESVKKKPKKKTTKKANDKEEVVISEQIGINLNSCSNTEISNVGEVVIVEQSIAQSVSTKNIKKKHR